MRAGILGGFGGRRWLAPLQEAGCEVVGPVESPGRDALDGCELVIVASPIAERAEWLERLADRAVLCEVPFLPHAPPRGYAQTLARRRVWAAMPYRFTDLAQRIAVNASKGHVYVGASVQESMEEVLLVRAAEPLSLLLARLGWFTARLEHRTAERVDAELGFDRATWKLTVERLPLQTWEHGIRCGERAILGTDRAILGWQGRERLREEPGARDRARIRLVESLVRHLRGETTRAEGVPTATDALVMLTELAPLLG